MQAKRLIHSEIERSLPQYDQWKMNPRAVPEVAGAYLEILEPSVEKYVDGLIPPEKDCVEYFLAGIKPHAVLQMRKVKREGVSRADLHKWLWGDREEWGFIQVMFRIFARNAAFCPFCHGGPRWSGNSPHPKVSGSVCDHEARWWAEAMKEGGNG